jgi:hypothetical protein
MTAPTERTSVEEASACSKLAVARAVSHLVE